MQKYDILCIGLGPAGMAVSIMGSNMGLSVCAVEKYKIGGECMNCGCIPSKALLRRAKVANYPNLFASLQLSQISKPQDTGMFAYIRQALDKLNKNKNSKLLEKVELIYGEAEFIDKTTIQVNQQKITAKKIFICTGTKPMIPAIEGMDSIPILTNENLFNLDEFPQSLLILGGGAIGTEMAEAFARMGTEVTIVNDKPHLVPHADKDAAALLTAQLNKQGIKILCNQKIVKVAQQPDNIIATTNTGEQLIAQKILVAAGRTFANVKLGLDAAGIKQDHRGAIIVDKYLRTSNKKVFAVGDCNGNSLLSHSAMHQGMLAIINSMSPIKLNFHKYIVPWTVFTDPQISAVGLTEQQLQQQKIKYSVVKVNYDDYGAAIVEKISLGFIKVFVSPMGKIYGVTIIGEGSGEMINEWALAIQNNLSLLKIMLLQHSFPTMGFLSKRVAEVWMMEKMQSKFLRTMIKLLYL